MKEKGYLASKLITINSFYLPKPRTQQATSSVKLLMYLNEGDQTLVQSVSLKGVTALSLDESKKLLRVQEGAPLNLFAFGEGIENLKKTFRDKGYFSFKIENEGTDALIAYSQENRLADIKLEIEEGPQFRVSQVEVEGLVKTKEYIVHRELVFHPGEILGESQLLQSEIQLKRLGIFSSVVIRIETILLNPATKLSELRQLKLIESLAWGTGFRNDLGIRAFGQLSYTNLWGMNHTVSVSASVNRRFYNYNFAEGQVQFSYLWPWFGLPGLTFRPAISMTEPNT